MNLSPGDIEEVIGTVSIDKHIFGDVKSNEQVESPGMKYKHYAPNTKAILIYGDTDQKYIDLINKYKKKKTTIIGFKEHEHLINGVNYYVHGSKDNLEEISHNIFSLLRTADKDNSDIIIIEGVAKKGLGIAIMNRLLRSCSFNYFEE